MSGRGGLHVPPAPHARRAGRSAESARAAERLEELAQADPAVARLALLQAEALRSSPDLLGTAPPPHLDDSRLDSGIPLLHGGTLYADPGVAARLLGRLVALAEQTGFDGATPLDIAMRAGSLDPLHLAQAELCRDAGWQTATAERLGLEPEVLSVFGDLLALPLLRTFGAEAAHLLAEAGWTAGFCPLCAAWPTLAERRGLELEYWPRCGRCGAGWRLVHGTCVYCGNVDSGGRGYLAGESERESRRADTCARCRGYLKSIATLGPLDPTEIAVQDLTSLELDVAALGRGYRRPDRPGFALRARVEPARRRSWPSALGLAWPSR